MAHLLLHAISHSLEDVIKSAPILLVVYAVLYWLEHKMRAAPALLEKAQKVGPVIGGLAGSVPQCGFSAAASALFAEGFLHPATLVAVFLATSDEAVPLLLSGGMAKETLLLLISKLVLAVAGGYLLQWTVFRKGLRNQAPVRVA
ncbi:MAG: arsenic efflux protein, partial [Butyricicoccus sp.]